MTQRYAVVLGAGLMFVLVTGLFAEETPIEGQLSAKLASGYVWRGRPINDAAVIQPEVSIGKDPFTFDVWGTWDWDADEDTPGRTRNDLSLDYSFTWWRLFCKAGGVAYAYHDGPPEKSMKDTFELYFEAMADVLLNPSVIVYYDVKEIEGAYAALSVGDGIDLGKGFDLQMRLRLGVASSSFNKKFFRIESIEAEREDDFSPGAGVVDLSGTVKVVIPAGERVTFVPAYEYTTLLNSDLRDIVKDAGKDADNGVFSGTLTWSF